MIVRCIDRALQDGCMTYPPTTTTRSTWQARASSLAHWCSIQSRAFRDCSEAATRKPPQSTSKRRLVTSVLPLARWPQAWWKVMAAYRQLCWPSCLSVIVNNQDVRSGPNGQSDDSILGSPSSPARASTQRGPHPTFSRYYNLTPMLRKKRTVWELRLNEHFCGPSKRGIVQWLSKYVIVFSIPAFSNVRRFAVAHVLQFGLCHKMLSSAVCMQYACIVTKRFNLGSRGFHRKVQLLLSVFRFAKIC